MDANCDWGHADGGFAQSEFLLRHEKVSSTQHNMILSLAPYRPDTTIGFPLPRCIFWNRTDTNC